VDPGGLFGLVYIAAAFLMVFSAPGAGTELPLLWATPQEFALYIFQNYWFFIEIISLLLLVALIGAFRLGGPKKGASQAVEDKA
jgi:NADH:ubiquinone oxidoreductase subunit 6 (subunit J)